MNLTQRQLFLWLTALFAVAPVAQAQVAETAPHMGYVFPAGGRVDTTVQVVVGGQHLDGVTDVCVSGQGIQATVVKHTKPLTQREVNQLREKLRQAREKARAANKNGKRDVIDEETAKFAKELGVTDQQREAYDRFQKERTDPKRQPNAQIAEKVHLQVQIGPDAELGVCQFRLKTPAGLSNPLCFHVRNLPECCETEPNDEATVAEIEAPFPVILNGQILPGDVDRFSFQARKGDRLVAAVSARELIPYLADAVPGWFQATLALLDAEGNEVAYADDFRFHPDPVLYFKIPQSGRYVLEIKDAIYRGREDFVYRITLGEIPFVTSVFPLGGRRGDPTSVEVMGWNLRARSLPLDTQDRTPGVHSISVSGDKRLSNLSRFAVDTLPECLDKEPNNEAADAQSLRPPLIVNGRMDYPGDWDVFCFQGRAGGHVVAEVQARRLSSPLDSLLKITDTSGHPLMVNDDHEDKGAGLTTHHADSWLGVTLPETGRYYVHLGDAQNKGGPEYGYRLRLSARRPDFELRVVPSALNARAGATVPITVYALRRDDFSEDIWLAIKDGPPGFSLSGAWVPAGHDQVRLTLTVPPVPLEQPVRLQMEGRAVIRGREVRRPVVPAEDMMQAFIYRHLVPARDFLVSVSEPLRKKRPKPPRAQKRGPAPVTSFGSQPVKLAAGGSMEIKLPAPGGRSVRQVHLQLNQPPEGVTMQRLFSGPDGLAVLLHADAAKVEPGLKGNLIVQAFSGRPAVGPDGKPRGNRNRPLGTLPAIPFEIVPPDQPALPE